MNANEKKYNDLLELMNAMKAKLDLYEKFENAREKEFRELERDVHRLKNETANSFKLPKTLKRDEQADYDNMAGLPWLR